MIKFYTKAILLMLLICLANTNLFADREGDSLALVALYNSTDGDNWINNTNWLTNEPIDNWFGITVVDNRVTKIILLSQNMIGPIPSEIGNIINLKEIDIYYNKLTNIPNTIGNLINLEIFSSYGNPFESIPLEFGDLINLKVLKLGSSNLSGEIPIQLFNLTNLEEFAIHVNQFTGPIPKEISNLTNLKILALRDNQFTGLIPKEIFSLINLETLLLNSNKFIGPIPPEIGNLKKLERLEIGDNQFQCEIPAEIGGLDSLIELKADGAGFLGQIPSEIGNLKKLYRISLNSNALTSIPPELGNCTNLREVYLDGNKFTSPLPKEIGNLKYLIVFQANGSQLPGEIPPELGNCEFLKTLQFKSNQLTGEIPPELGSMTNTEELELTYNQLTGEIPKELANLTKLARLYLGGNQLSGEIPRELSNLKNLQGLSLWSNNFTGEIPQVLSNLKNLQGFKLFSNNLIGEIPSEFASMPNLNNFQLHDNNLTGEVPQEFKDAPALETFYIYDNDFTDLPDLTTMPALKNFYVYNNKFEFDDLEHNVDMAISDYKYIPQDSVGAERNDTLCVKSEYVLDVQVGGANNLYQWYKDDLAVTEVLPESEYKIDSAFFTNNGTYICHVTNTVIDGLTIYSRPMKLFVFDFDAEITGTSIACSNSNEIYSVEKIDGIFYQWSVIGGLIIGSKNEESVEVRWTNEGTGELKLTQIHLSLGCTDSAKIEVNVLPGIDAEIFGSDEVGLNATTEYYTNPTADVINAWSVSAGGIITGAKDKDTVKVLWMSEGSSSVTLIRKHTSGMCPDTANMPVEIAEVKALSITGNEEVCEDNEYTYSTIPDAQYENKWHITGGTVLGASDESAVKVKWEIEGLGIIKLVQTDTGLSATDSLSKDITINPLPEAEISGESVVLSKSLQSYSTTSSTDLENQWSVTGGTIDGDNTGSTIQVTWGDTGYGTVLLTQTNTTTGCKDSSSMKVTFSDIKPREVTLRIASSIKEHKPGDIVTIPIYLLDEENLEGLNVNGFEGELRFNASLLVPGYGTEMGTRTDNERVIPLNLHATPNAEGILLPLNFQATLGNDTTTTLAFENMKSIGDDIEIIIENGVFTLDGVCMEGGVPRLISTEGKASIELLRPNPTENKLTIDYELIEKGLTEIYLVNSFGERVKTIVSKKTRKGKYTVETDLNDLSSGLYFIILQTPTVRKAEKVEVVK